MNFSSAVVFFLQLSFVLWQLISFLKLTQLARLLQLQIARSFLTSKLQQFQQQVLCL